MRQETAADSVGTMVAAVRVASPGRSAGWRWVRWAQLEATDRQHSCALHPLPALPCSHLPRSLSPLALPLPFPATPHRGQLCPQ